MKTVQIIISIAFLAAIYMISPLISAIGMGIIFAILLTPILNRLTSKRLPRSATVGLLTFAVTVLLIAPASTLTVLAIKSGVNELKHTKMFANPKEKTDAGSGELVDKLFDQLGINTVLVKASTIVQIDPQEISDELKKGLGALAGRMTEILSDFISGIPSLLINFAVFLFSLYYFLLDGERFISVIKKRSLFSPKDTTHLMKTFSELCRSVIMASIIAGGTQAVLASIASLTVGIKQFPTVFIAVFICSFIPMIGSFPLMAGMTLFQFLTGHPGAGIVLGLATILISTIDNLIRPQVIKGGSNLHPLLAFIAALGGIHVFGFVGIFLGPVLIGFLVEVFTINAAAE